MVQHLKVFARQTGASEFESQELIQKLGVQSKLLHSQCPYGEEGNADKRNTGISQFSQLGISREHKKESFSSNKVLEKSIDDPVTSTCMHLPSHTRECMHTSTHSPQVSSTSTICLRDNIIVKEISKIRSCKFAFRRSAWFQ